MNLREAEESGRWAEGVDCADLEKPLNWPLAKIGSVWPAVK
jgi:hypothetical protein